MGIYEKLLKVQGELKAPKGQRNKFGNYNYRSCEDILEAVKPIAHKYNCLVLLSDELKVIGERYYIEVTATFVDCESGEKVEVFAEARESETKKGMDDSQITGATSSYARKYALNGLFAIDDTKDADTNEHTKQVAEKPISIKDLRVLDELIKSAGSDPEKVKVAYNVKAFKELTYQQYDECCRKLQKKIDSK